MSSKGHILCDLDGTLARYESGYVRSGVIGEPLEPMLERVKTALDAGEDVRIFTARVSRFGQTETEAEWHKSRVELWCVKHLGCVLPVTSEKDFNTVEIWDDRARRVLFNDGNLA